MALATLTLAWPGPALAQIENRLILPHAEVTVGAVDSTIDVLCDHDFDMVGYSLHIVFEATKIRVTEAVKGPSVENLIPDGFFLPTIESNAVLVGAVFDVFNSAQLPPGQGDSLLTVRFEILAAPGESVDLVFEDDPDPGNARKNRLSSTCPDSPALCSPLLPALQNGSVVTVFSDRITVYAGPDRAALEGAPVTLNGFARNSTGGTEGLALSWSQLSGPAVENPFGGDTVSFSFDLPAVTADTILTLELEAADASGMSTDIVEVRIWATEGIEADAGPDRVAAENVRIVLTGSGSSQDPQLPLSFQWSRFSGPDLVKPVGGLTPSLEFTVPPVDGDQPTVIELKVSDTVRTATDLVVVDVVDLDLRQASVEAPASEARIYDDGSRAVVYAGQIAWNSVMEDATWTRIEFSTIASAGSSAALERATLYIDRDGDGIPGEDDTQLGSAPIDNDSAVLPFQFAQPLTDGDRLDVLLVVNLADGRFEAAGSWLLALLVGLALAGGRRNVSPAISTLVGVLAIAALAVLPLACSSGGGGRGFAPSASPTREVHFELDASGVVIHGQTTGASIPVSGGIQTGPTLSF